MNAKPCTWRCPVGPRSTAGSWTWLAVASVLSTLCSACTTTAQRPSEAVGALAPPSPRGGANGAANSDGEANGATEIERYIGVDRSSWPERVQPNGLADLYTRIEVETDAPATESTASARVIRSYDLEKRNIIERIVLNSKTVTITTIANAELNSPDVTTALPLFSVSHVSARGSGETFLTKLTSSDVQAPLFRIGPNTTLTIHLDSAASDQQKFDATPLIFKAVQTAVGLAAPATPILTALSKADLSNTANAIDTTLGGLTSQDVTEDIELGRLVDTWSPDAELKVFGRTPKWLIRTVTETDSGDLSNKETDSNVGTWHIRLTCPRPSYFDTVDVCSYTTNATGAVKITLDAAKLPETLRALKVRISNIPSSQVLQAQLSSQITVEQFVQTQSWYTAFLQTPPKSSDDTKTFCAQAMTSLYAVGLNQFDAALVLKAMATSMPGIVTLKSDVSIASSCQDLVKSELSF